jgi:hypothetical protein
LAESSAPIEAFLLPVAAVIQSLRDKHTCLIVFTLWLDSVKALDFAQRAKFLQVVNVLTSMQTFIQTMRGQNASVTGFAGPELHAPGLEHGEGSPPVVVCIDLILKLRRCFMDGQYEAAMAVAQEVEPLLWSAQCHIQAADYYYYTALAIAGMIGPSAPASRRLAEAIKPYLAKLSAWAENPPSNLFR